MQGCRPSVRPSSAARVRSRLARLGAAALAALLVALCAAPSQAAAASHEGVFGVNPGDLFKLPEAQWDAHLGLLSSQGVRVMRLGAWWSDLEPAPPVNGRRTYAWGDVDRQVAALARHGIRWEPLLCFSTTWGSAVEGDYTARPANPDDFAAFGAALARRYGRGGTFWQEHPQLPALPVLAYEVWNEMNAPVYWHPAERPAEHYADLYAATRSAIHAVDGQSRVVVGGLAAAKRGVMAPEEFLRRMIAHRPALRGNLDAVGLHPYAGTPEGVYEKVATFRATLDEVAGPGVPIEITEIGWTGADLPEQERAQRLAAVAATLPRSDCGIERVMPYAWIGPELDPDDREQWFGMAKADGTPKASATAYAAAIRRVLSLGDGEPVAMCRQAAAAAPRTQPVALRTQPGTTARTTKARLRMKLRARRRSARRARLLVRARCAVGCRLNVTVRRARVRRLNGRLRVTRPLLLRRRAVAATRRRHRVGLRLGRRAHRRGTRLLVEVVAVMPDGAITRRARAVRVR